MNKVILMGRLTRDPMVSYSSNQNANGEQTAVARFTVAVDRRFARRDANGQSEADFIGCVAFGRQGEFAEKYLKQGTKVVLEGRIQTGSYTNKDGQRVYTTDVIAENIEFAESKAAASGNNGGFNNGGNFSGAGQQSAGRPAPEAAADGFMNIADGVEDEGLPFN